ncbi:MAG: hypothetical protein R3F60_29825 [bacterium]
MRYTPFFVVIGAFNVAGCDAQKPADEGAGGQGGYGGEPDISNDGWYDDGYGGYAAEGGGGVIGDAYVSDNSGWYDAEVPPDVDAGPDATVQLDAGGDGAVDGGGDGGADGGADAGPPDGGPPDEGADAAPPDGGADAGVEAPDAAPDAPDGQACAPGRHGLDWTALAFCAPEGVPAGLRPYRGQTSPFLVDADLVTAG